LESPTPFLRPAVFLDRDGTLIEDSDYLGDPAGVVMLPGVGPALRRLREAGFALVVVTNQAGVARGFYAEHDVRRVNEEVDRRLRAEGVDVLAWDYCPHLDGPEAKAEAYRTACDCRKPGPGMLQRMARQHGLDPAQSFVVGDKRTDLQAAKAAGMRAVLVLTGKGRQFCPDGTPPPEADGVAEDLAGAAGRLLRMNC
jgi:D-glycero-D-manno-heptose 1,7-bisphosphate phosphatase